jgi:hypothetical protein
LTAGCRKLDAGRGWHRQFAQQHVGDLLIGDDVYDDVTVSAAAFGSTSSAQWTDSAGEIFKGLMAAWCLFKAHDYADDEILHLHQQGEADAAMPFPTPR